MDERWSENGQKYSAKKSLRNDYAVIYATQQALLCSGYWSAVVRELESRREKMFSTWR